MKASLIISVYNQARNLELILETVNQQACKDVEIVVADDGSSDYILSVIEKFRLNQPDIPLEFVTQEDRGFRKTMILNKAIAQSRMDYLIFLDGDMLLEKHLIELHLRYRKPNYVLCGHRGVKLNKAYTNKITSGEVVFKNSVISLIAQAAKGNIENPLRGLILKNSFLRKLFVHSRNNLSGCNFSLYRDAIEKVNGFNEDILEHGYNDYELGCRLKNSGYEIVDVSKLCNTFHLYHNSRKTNREETESKKHKVLHSASKFCINGLSKYQS